MRWTSCIILPCLMPASMDMIVLLISYSKQVRWLFWMYNYRNDKLFRGPISLSFISGAHYDIVDHSGYTMLAFALLNGHSNVLKQLLAAGAEINKGGYLNQTALHHAVVAAQLHCLQLLLDHGANPNAVSTEHHTSLFCSLLHVNTTNKDFLTWKALVRANTNIEIEDSVNYYS